MYKCPWTGSLFEMSEKKEYVKHLKALRKTHREKWRMTYIRKGFDSWLDSEKSKITDVNQIESWVLDNQQKLFECINSMDIGSFDGGFKDGDRLERFKLGGLRHSPIVSNTHDSPRNGVTNFFSKPDLPKGYPGWAGRVEGALIRKRQYNGYPITSLLKCIDLHTGSGGGGNSSWSYGVKIFVDDWPSLIHGLHGQLWQEQEEATLKAIVLEERRIIRRLKHGYN